MPLGGESIGRAYVRILADGSGFAADVERQLEGDPAIAAAGRRMGKDYQEGFDEEVKKNSEISWKKQLKDLRKRTGKLDAEGKFAGSKFMDGLQDFLKMRFKDVGVEMFREIHDGLASGRIKPENIDTYLNDLRPRIARATAQIQRDEEAAAKESLARQQKLASEIMALNKRKADDDAAHWKFIADIAKEGRDKQDKLARETMAIQGRADRDRADSTRRLIAQFKDLGGAVDDYHSKTVKGDVTRRRLKSDLAAISATMPSAVTGTREYARRMGDLNEKLRWVGFNLRNLPAQLTASGNAMGRAFGRGSRNNFLNALGGFVSLAPRLIGSFAGATKAVTGFFGELQRVYSEAGTVRQGILNVGSAIAGLASSSGRAAIVVLVGLALAMEALVFSSGLLASALSLASGWIIAVAGSLSFALGGALSVAALAILPLVAGVGALVIGISALSKKTEAFKALKREWKDMRREVSKEIFGKDGAGLKNVQNLLTAVKPLLLAAGTAVGGLLTQLGKTAQSKGFQTMMGEIAKILPGMVESLGKIGGNLLLAVGRAFIAAEPFITEFLGWLEDVTDALADAGKGGKDSPMADWFEKAAKSAKKVGKFVKETIGLIGDLLGAGKGTGDSIFVTLTGHVKKFRTWLKKAEEDGSLKQFFTDAKKLGGKIGDIVVDVVKLVEALDTPANRTLLFKLLDVIDKIITGITSAATAYDNFLTKLFGPTPEPPKPFLTDRDGGKDPAQPRDRSWEQSNQPGFEDPKNPLNKGGATDVSGIIAEIKAKINAAWSGGFGGGAAASVEDVKQLFVDLQNALVGNSIVPDTVDSIVGIFGGLGGRINFGPGLLGKFMTWMGNLPAAAGTTATGIASRWAGLGGKMLTGAGNLASRFGSWLSPTPGKSGSTAGQIASSWANLAGKMLGKAGSLASRFSSWLSTSPGKSKNTATSIAASWANLSGKMVARAGNLGSAFGRWISAAATSASKAALGVVKQFSGLNGKIVKAIGDVTITAKVKLGPLPNAPTIVAKIEVPKTAMGGIFSGAQIRMIGEAGPEAVVPLNRPLSQVDPAVRELSAIAQGLKKPNMASGGGNMGKIIDVGGIQIITPTEDPRAVASEVVARMAAASYL